VLPASVLTAPAGVIARTAPAYQLSSATNTVPPFAATATP
jgi:hypothetical protein